MWWRFRRHKVAVVAGIIVAVIYFVAIFAEVLAPTDPNATARASPTRRRKESTCSTAPPTARCSSGSTCTATSRRSTRERCAAPSWPIPTTRSRSASSSKARPTGCGESSWDRHLIGPVDPSQPFYLLGADRLGRDNLSRIIHGARVSMSIGLGVALSLVLGVILGGVSGYFGGRIDGLIQRTIEFLRSMPTIPLWMGLAAAIPLTWPPLGVYFMITVLLSLIGWTTLRARCAARSWRRRARISSSPPGSTASRSSRSSRASCSRFASHIIAVTTLAIPEMILAETALSFLGIGLQPPVVSWGVLLKEAQNVNTVATAPWLLIPGFAVVTAVLALNFLGDGLRDAADLFHRLRPAMSDVLLEVRGLKTHFFTREGVVKAVDGLDLVLRRNRTLSVVGEFGCGKSISAWSILKLIREPGRIVAGEILLHNRDGSVTDLARLKPNSAEIRGDPRQPHLA